MAYRLRSALFLLAPFAWAVACGGDTFGVADSDATGGGSSDSDTSSDGSSDTTTDDDGYVIPNNCGNEIAGECVVDDDCVGAVDVCIPCYQGSCTAPVAASCEDTLTQGCLRTWARRFEGPTESCQPVDVACPAIACPEVPQCPVASCSEGKCKITVLPGACVNSGSGGAASGGSSSGGASSGGTGSGGVMGVGGMVMATGGMIMPSGGVSPI